MTLSLSTTTGKEAVTRWGSVTSDMSQVKG